MADGDKVVGQGAGFYASRLVLASDSEGYRHACAATLERLGRSDDPLIGEAARACLIGPEGVADTSVPRRLAAAALAREPEAPWLHYILGLADFRAGRCEAAIEHLATSLGLGGGWAAAPLNHPVLAMAHHRLGQQDEARRWLKKAHGLKPREALPSSAVWWDRVEFQLLLREADARILDAE